MKTESELAHDKLMEAYAELELVVNTSLDAVIENVNQALSSTRSVIEELKNE